MRKCLVCGFKNPDGTKFCGSCGSSITTGEKRCPKCGKLNPSDSKFCLECGVSLTTGSLIQASKESDTLVIGAMETGGTIGGRYKIKKKLGQGGFGATYLVEHTGLGKELVLKELLRKSTKAWELFKREATTLSKLDVKGVPKVIDYFEEQGKLYLVEDYIEGKTLREVLQMKKKLTEKESRWLLLELLKIVEGLHRQGVIHRDIKPENIIISAGVDRPRGDSERFLDRSKIYLIDFGSVKEASQEVIAGKTGTAVFSHGYAAPEQLQGKIGYESDIYAVGMIIAEVLTGKHPTDLREEIEDIKLRITDSRLAEVVQKMTLFERKKRYKSVKDVVKDITDLGEYTNNKQGLLNKNMKEVKKDISEVDGEARPVLPKVDTDKKVLIASKKEEAAEKEVKGPEKKKKYLIPKIVGLILVIIAGLVILRPKSEDKITAKKESTKSSLRTGIVKTIGRIKFVYIKGGTFWMGSPAGEGDKDEHPRHQVYVSSFWMGKYEVTQSQYRAIMGNNPSRFKGDNHPVERVSWDDAIEFCRKFSQRYGVKVRLPYEAEWEYACRAGSTTKYYWGNSMDGSYCWYSDNSGSKTHPVGQKRPNRWGLYDMSGNVWEWCMDWYDKNYYSNSPSNNPKGPSSGKYYKVLRGGSWYYVPRVIRSASRVRNDHVNWGSYYLGFRLVVPFK